jgi:diaminopimelate epimerase
MEFHKIHGAGNDFIVVDNWSGMYNQWPANFIRGICAFHTGIGADGFLVIEKSGQADFRMRFFNSDGYEAEMCVNGSRCIGYIAYQLNRINEKYTFEAGDGIHSGEILDSGNIRVQVLWQQHRDSRTFPVDLVLPDHLYFKRFLNTGVPHLILECTDVDSVPVEDIGEKLRFHPYYYPEGTNVNFVQIISDQKEINLKIRTYERGVDAETLSCGSGATACAIAYCPENPENDLSIEVQTRGGKLFISILKNYDDIYLEGPVAYIYKGIYTKEGIL